MGDASKSILAKQVTDTLRQRLAVHRQQIRNPNVRMLYVIGHICVWSKQLDIKFKVFPLYIIETDSIIAR